jgi:hypothetical protein
LRDNSVAVIHPSNAIDTRADPAAHNNIIVKHIVQNVLLYEGDEFGAII